MNKKGSSYVLIIVLIVFSIVGVAFTTKFLEVSFQENKTNPYHKNLTVKDKFIEYKTYYIIDKNNDYFKVNMLDTWNKLEINQTYIYDSKSLPYNLASWEILNLEDGND